MVGQTGDKLECFATPTRKGVLLVLSLNNAAFHSAAMGRRDASIAGAIIRAVA